MIDKPIATRPYSSHPGDSHLQVVLHKNFKGEYVTHVQNFHTGGFAHGHYFGGDTEALKKATQDFKNR